MLNSKKNERFFVDKNDRLLYPTDIFTLRILIRPAQGNDRYRFRLLVNERRVHFGEDGMYVIGIDVGTSGTKAVLLDRQGNIAGQGYQGYKLYSEGNCVEQDAEDWWKACIAAVHQAVSPENRLKVSALSLSTQGASMLALDGGGNPVGRALTWMDTRSQAEADTLEACLGGDSIYHTTGWRMVPSCDAAKIRYMKAHKKYEGAKKYLSTLEFINLKMTGNAVIDPTNAAIRQLFNIHTGAWDKKILDAVGVTEAELPATLKAGQPVGALISASAEALGLSTAVTVYNGAHDQYCASIGCGAVHPGDMLISTGTAWVIMGISGKPIYSPTFISPSPHPAPGLYGNMASLGGVGSSFQWIGDKFFPGQPLSQIDDNILSSENTAEVLAKNAGLFFIPWLAGAGYPVGNPAARGGFIGMDFTTGPYDMALAVLESAVFSLKNAMNDFEKNGFNPSVIKIMGGAAKSKIWMDILAAAIDVPIYKMRIADSCALGAAFIAACGERWYKDYVEVANAVVTSEAIRGSFPDKNLYEEKFRRYGEVLKCMELLFKKGEGYGAS
jgi:sugar (pentulose or hexulose) kinase